MHYHLLFVQYDQKMVKVTNQKYMSYTTDKK